MKIKLFFDSRNEFAEFILSASSIHFGSKFQEMRGAKNLRGIEFLELVFEVEVEGVCYTVAKVVNSMEGIGIVNYMLNDVQINNDSISFSMPGDGSEVRGSEKVKDLFLQQLPSIFRLRIGWRTDYEAFIFKKL